MILEVCIDNFEKGLQACSRGAKRLELCSDLALEGFTPGEELVEEFLKASKVEILGEIDELVVPIHVMIRPPKRDCSHILDTFCYNDKDLQEMKDQIRKIRELIEIHSNENSRFKIEGFVIGCIKKESDEIVIDTEFTKQLSETIRENNGYYNITFHKAFDLLTHPVESTDILKQLGINRILTSLCFACTDLKGKITTAIQSNNLLIDQFLTHLKGINQHENTTMTLLIGGGVREGNQMSILEFMNQQAIIPFELHSSTPFHTKKQESCRRF